VVAQQLYTLWVGGSNPSSPTNRRHLKTKSPLALADTYLVTDKRTVISEEEIVLLEKYFGLPAPMGYREFMTSLGAGLYCDLVRVYRPLRVLTEYQDARERWRKNFLWDGGAHVLSREQVLRSVIFGDTVDGDQIVVAPHEPLRLFVLSRHDETIWEMDAAFADPLFWRGSTFAPQWSPFRYFESSVDRASIELFTQKRRLRSDDVAAQFIFHWRHSELCQIKEEGCRIIFLKSIGGRVQLAQSSWDGRIRIVIGFDKDYKREVEAFLPTLGCLGFHVTRKSPGLG
jgi:hypothetical protein